MSKVAIVTGASRGIGKEIAKMLANEGIQVIANYNKSEEQAIELQKENRWYIYNTAFFIMEHVVYYFLCRIKNWI